MLHAKIPYLGEENHRTADYERHLSRSLSPTTWFWIAPRMDTPYLFVFHLLSWWRSFFICLNGVFFISVWIHCLLSCHWTSQKRDRLSSLGPYQVCIYSLLHICMCIANNLPAFSKLMHPSNFSFSSNARCFRPLITFLALFQTHCSHIHVTLYWRAKDWTQQSSLQVPRGRITSL